MRIQFSRIVMAGLVLALSSALELQAQENKEIEVLARGPVHEAFAATLEVQKNPIVVTKIPPEPIEELPPDQKPEGENVQWVPGYWHFDEDREDYIWISGFWRVPPPGRVWMPGSWREVRGGYQWAHGFWQDAQPEAPQGQLEYLSAPPAPIEVAPSIPAPSETHIYVPGTWVWRTHRYVWRPGFWVDHRPGWVWVPSHYRWTPAGYVFIEGYWDMPLAERGVLFAPVYVPQSVYFRPSFVYTPTFVVSEPALYTSLFVRRGWGCYYFGDYYDARYSNFGFSSWCPNVRGSGFGVSIGFGRSIGYDPLWDYYRVAYRNNIGWAAGINSIYTGRFNGTLARPPRTLVQQNVIVNNITNVTNNTNIVNNNTNIVNNQIMLTTLNNVAKSNQAIALKPIRPEQRVQEQQFAQEIKKVSAQRKQIETSFVDRGQIPLKANIAPQSAKIDFSKAAVQRAQMPPLKYARTTETTLGGQPPVSNKPSPAGLKPTPVTVPAPITGGQKPSPTVPVRPGSPSLKPGTTPAPLPAPSVKPGTRPVPTPSTKPMPPTSSPSVKPSPIPGTPRPPVSGQKPAPTPVKPPVTAPKPSAPTPVKPPVAAPKPSATPPSNKPSSPPPSNKPKKGDEPTVFRSSSPDTVPQQLYPRTAAVKSYGTAQTPSYKPAPTNQPTVFQPARSTSGFNPAPISQPAPSYKPAPVTNNRPTTTYRPAPTPSYKPAPVPSYKPAPVPSYKPAPVTNNRPTTTYRPAPAPTPSYKPAPITNNRPTTTYRPAPMPSYKPAPAPSYKPSNPSRSIKPSGGSKGSGKSGKK